ncbi:sugar transferase [Parvibaculum lavamentivorans DS-1]|uniref:Sugar transferase n=1 Tax=Parvibaculum lavamentivorans (strain DS-1 / DSM 13023 / NCIMB 13966) TaxID=402881 RepID=A7HUF7_PARL1|nr:undecaprenyl-phosphate glucose phosphotransferase [Parvibaculum lavamentivorans]ABS63540.1 sugar transferase [Parvibaculum lavamentivorans DS-1]
MRGFGDQTDDEIVLAAPGVTGDVAAAARSSREAYPASGDFLKDQPLISKQVISDITMCADGVIIFVAALIAKWAYIGQFLDLTRNSTPYAVIGGVGAVLAVAMLKYQGIYQFNALSNGRGQKRRILIGLFVTALLLVGIGYLLKISEQYSRGWFVAWFGLSTVLVLSLHFAGSRFLQWLVALGSFARNVVIYGSGEIAESVIRGIGTSSMNLRVIGVFDDLPPDQIPRVPVRGGLSDLIVFGQKHRIDEVLIAMPLTSELRIANLVEQLSLLPTDIRICPSAAAFRIPPKGLLNYQGLAVLELERRPMDGWAPIIKSIEDRVLAALLLIGFAPLLLLVAAAVKLDSRGPVIFKQKRHGFNHEVFNLYKFRTMYVAEGSGRVVQATRNDPRVTRVGRFLRKTSLDELPQLFNVLIGEMSLVGPRPHAIAHNEYYSAVLDRYANRHKVKPGMTGWAQVKGYRGETDTPEKMRRRVEHDLYYIENWSVWLDLKIIIMTPFYGFIGKNAF